MLRQGNEYDSESRRPQTLQLAPQISGRPSSVSQFDPKEKIAHCSAGTFWPPGRSPPVSSSTHGASVSSGSNISNHDSSVAVPAPTQHSRRNVGAGGGLGGG